MRFVILLFALFIFSCEPPSENDHLFTLPSEWPIEDSVLNTVKQKIENGDVEYFSINGSKFRFQKNPQKKNQYDLQVLENNQWLTNLTLSMPKWTFLLTHDFDLDKYFDLSLVEYGDLKIYFFDRSKRRFNSESLQFPSDCALLDSSKLIYGANNHGDHIWNVDIFSIRGYSKTYLYKANLFLKSNTYNGSFEITNALIYKCNNGSNTDTVLVDKININKQFSDFSLLYFMKDIAHNRVYR